MKKTIYVVGNRRGKRLAAKKQKMAKNSHVHYFIMTVVLPVHKAQGVIKYPKGGKAKVAEHATNIVTSCTGNSWVTISEENLALVTAAIGNYTSATAANRPGKKTLMTNAIEDILLAPFQAKANTDPVNSIEILRSGGFHVKEQAIPSVRQFKVTNAADEGSVEIQTAGGPKNKAHLFNWYFSTDRITWEWKMSTNSSKTMLSGFESGKVIYFMVEMCVQDVSQGMSQIIEIRIK